MILRISASLVLTLLLQTALAAASTSADLIRQVYKIKTVNGLSYSSEYLKQEPQRLEQILKSTFRFGNCSGTFVSKYGHVLTALHCVENLMDITGAPPWGKVRNPEPPYNEYQGHLILAKPFSSIDNSLIPIHDWHRSDFDVTKDAHTSMKIHFKGAGVPNQFPSYIESEQRYLLTPDEMALGKKLNQDFAIIQIDTRSLNRPWACAPIQTQIAATGTRVFSAGYPNEWGKTPEANYIPAVTSGQLAVSEKDLPYVAGLIPFEVVFPDNGMYYTNAATAQGMSGGGLFNDRGELIGVNSAGQGRIFSKRSYQVRADFIWDKIREQKPESYLKFVFDCR